LIIKGIWRHNKNTTTDATSKSQLQTSKSQLQTSKNLPVGKQESQIFNIWDLEAGILDLIYD